MGESNNKFQDSNIFKKNVWELFHLPFFFPFLYYPLMCHLISAIWKSMKLECILVFFYFSIIYIPIILVPSAILELWSFLAQCNFFFCSEEGASFLKAILSVNTSWQFFFFLYKHHFPHWFAACHSCFLIKKKVRKPL